MVDRNIISTGYIFPSLEEEIGKYSKYFKGKVLNAGSGTWRDISNLVKGELYNLDICPEGIVNVVAPIEKIPFPDNYFDCVICNAVLEHIINPPKAMKELYRVLKPKGYLYLCVPFLQPEHNDPHDYQRYTKEGLVALTKNEGFKVKEVSGILNVYQTIGWIITEWLNTKKTFTYRFLKLLFFPILRYKCKHSNTYVDSIATAYRIIATK